MTGPNTGRVSRRPWCGIIPMFAETAMRVSRVRTSASLTHWHPAGDSARPVQEAFMPQLSFPAVFMRGGTSRAIMFHARDLPERTGWDPIFLAAMGSPDPNGRQLNGMGGGISSLSKVCVLAPSDRADADIDYTFAQVQI